MSFVGHVCRKCTDVSGAVALVEDVDGVGESSWTPTGDHYASACDTKERRWWVPEIGVRHEPESAKSTEAHGGAREECCSLWRGQARLRLRARLKPPCRSRRYRP